MTIDVFGYTVDLAFLGQMTAAYVLALPIGFDREHSRRSAGLRTFPIVSVASCGFLLIALDVFGDDPIALARVLYGLMTGIGFIGGGAIVKESGTVHGTATAASIWATAGIGAAVAFDRYGIAITITLFTLFTLWAFKPIKGAMETRHHGGTHSDDGPQ